MGDRVVFVVSETMIILAGVLLGLFTALKLLGVILWSWWWVVSPLWGLIILGVFYSIAAIIITYEAFR